MSTPQAPTPTYDPNASAPRRRRRHRWRYVAAAGLVALIAYGLRPAPLPVEAGNVTRGPLQVTLDEEGVTQVRHRYVISSPVSGFLRRSELKPGAVVLAGQTIVAVLEPAAADILDTRELALATAQERAAASSVERAAAQRERAATEFDQARREADRQRQLAREGLISPQALETAETRERAAGQEDRAAGFALQVAQYEREQARARLQRNASAPADRESLMEITSPVSGRVLKVWQESARVVAGGLPLLEVGDPTDLEVRVEVLSRDGVAIAPGARVWLDQWGGDTPLEARVRLVEPAAFTKISALGVEEQRVNVLADLISPPEQRGNLGDGYRVEARIERARVEAALQVPAGALFQRARQWSTFVISHGQAQLRDVTPGLSNGIITAVEAGLEEGEQVIVYPGDRITDGIRVRAVD